MWGLQETWEVAQNIYIILMLLSSVIRQKGEFQNGCF